MSGDRTARRIAVLAARLGAVLATAVASAGCSHQADGSPPPPPAVLDPAPGAVLPTVTLSQPAFEAVRVQTTPVQAGAGGVAIPAMAVIYSPDGAAWTYVAVGPRCLPAAHDRHRSHQRR